MLMKPWCMTIHMRDFEKCFHLVLFIMLWNVVLTFESVTVTIKINTVQLTRVSFVCFSNLTRGYFLNLVPGVQPGSNVKSKITKKTAQ